MKFNFSYSFRLSYPVLIWEIACILFMLVALLNIGTFSSDEKTLLTNFSLLYILGNIIYLIIKDSRYSRFVLPQAKVLNDNIVQEKLSQELDSAKVSDTFIAFFDYSKKCTSYALISIVIFTFSICYWQFIYSDNSFNIILTLFTGILISSLLSGFSIFFPQLKFFSIARQCRDYLSSKGRCPIESNFQSIRVKFFFLLIFFLDTLILYFLSSYATYPISIIIYLTGLFMIIFDTLLLLFYLEKAFDEFFDLTKFNFDNTDLPIFSTGSLDKEFVNLAKFLNEISIQLYFFKEKTLASEKEMGNRMEELERFFDLTIEREERMIQLKKENAVLREKINGNKIIKDEKK
ncbi:MAG: hypothetical protein PHW52_04650 [Candidatus Pacebacteria bacterium]|nr:hypothetical protein [Candidatus Paceibacterota bacterium]